ncbi:MAG: hypothetical protein R6V27_04295 [Balneolaceae bacterium]
MTEHEVAVVAIVFGSILTVVFLGIVGSIIKTWIKNKNAPEDITRNKEFLSALRDFKEKTERRLSNLEAIVTEERGDLHTGETKKEINSGKNKREHSDSLGIEFDEENRKEESETSGNLRNMLNQ